MEAIRRLRVHVLIDSLGWGGAEVLLAELAEAASSAGIDLSVGYLLERDGSPAAERLRLAGIEPVLVPITSLLKPTDLQRVRRHLAAVQPDVLHTHLGYADFLGGIAARSLGVPAVSTIHVMEAEAGWRTSLKLSLMAKVRRTCMNKVIAVSDSTRRRIVERRWADAGQIVTVHNGVAARALPGAGPKLRERLEIAPGELVVTMVSVLRPDKRHDVALATMRALLPRFPGLRLLVVGDGPSRAEIERQAAELGNVLVLGHRDDVRALLDATDVLLHTSSVDAFPTALLEAMAASVPVVATAVGGVPEIVENGVTGVLVDPPPRPEDFARALEPLLSDPYLRHRLAKNGRLRFEREFTVERWADRMRVLYGEVAGQG
jgi:glycosyltransferase involved in cell wall biosynthesis